MAVFMTVWESAAEVALGDPIQYTSAVTGGANSSPISGSGRKRRRVRLLAQEDVWVAWGENPSPTGATDAMALGANNPEYIDIEAGHTLSAIARV